MPLTSGKDSKEIDKLKDWLKEQFDDVKETNREHSNNIISLTKHMEKN